MATIKRAIFGIAAAALLTCVWGAPARAGDYATNAARKACRAVGTCTVVDRYGEHESPCWPLPGGTEAYPGDPKWPFAKGVCDTVAQMNGFNSSAAGR